VVINTPSSTATPNKAINPTQTATEKLNPEKVKNQSPPAKVTGTAVKIKIDLGIERKFI
jgi:hypothetical protein